MRERDVERKLVRAVRDAGGLALKFVSPGMAGVPDRLLLEDVCARQNVVLVHGAILGELVQAAVLAGAYLQSANTYLFTDVGQSGKGERFPHRIPGGYDRGNRARHLSAGKADPQSTRHSFHKTCSETDYER